MDVVTVCPPLILGPLLQSTVNTSSSILINLIKVIPTEFQELVAYEHLTETEFLDVFLTG
uniref:Uncharacterized protein n=1 Tax=Oryza barthii TaxID=65489 RepID=A0A0D3GIS7_9ORYZ